MTRAQRVAASRRLLGERIRVLRGTLGAMIQSHQQREADDRGSRFKDGSIELEGNKDLLTLTRPQLMRDIHRQSWSAAVPGTT